MEYNQLPNSSLEVSAISLGCMSLDLSEQKASLRVLDKALEVGINLFDTADLYNRGENEAFLGKWMKGKRHDIIVATKVGNEWRSDGSGWDWNPTKKYIISAVERSLRRLGVDHIDLYQLHGGTIDDPIDDTIEAFEELKLAGKILHYGISSIRHNVIKTYVDKSNISTNMMQYSILDRRPEEFALGLLAENSIGVLARGALAKGLLINKPARNYLNYNAQEVNKVQHYLHNFSPLERAIISTKFVHSNPAITSAVIGVRTEEQMDLLTQAVEGYPKFDIDLAEIKPLLPLNFYEKHRTGLE